MTEFHRPGGSDVFAVQDRPGQGANRAVDAVRVPSTRITGKAEHVRIDEITLTAEMLVCDVGGATVESVIADAIDRSVFGLATSVI